MSPRGAGIKVCSGGITGTGEDVEGGLGMLIPPKRLSYGMASSMSIARCRGRGIVDQQTHCDLPKSKRSAT